MMILMSGLGEGTRVEIQNELSVGVGTLAGSTIMLLTVPWAFGVYLNRRVLGGPESRALSVEKRRIKKVLNKVTGQFENKPVFTLAPVIPRKFSWTKVGATALSTTSKGAIAMMVTALSYLIIQLPAFAYEGNADHGASAEKWFAFTGFWITLILFFAYLIWQYNDEDAVELIAEKQRRLCEQWMVIDGFRNLKRLLKGADPFSDAETLFELFDKDNNGQIDFEEMSSGWASIGYSFDDDQAKISFNLLDSDRDGTISRVEFINWIEDYLLPQFVASQPPAGPETPAVSDEPPVSLAGAVRQQISQFLADPAAKEIGLTLNKTERYAVHVWASASSHDLWTHSVDKDAQDAARGIRTLMLCKGTPPTSRIGSHAVSMKPSLRPVKPGMPVWCSVSSKLEAFYHNTDPASSRSTSSSVSSNVSQGGVFQELFRTIDPSGTGLVSLDQVLKFAQQFDVDLTPTQIKFQFYSRDQDLDHKINASELRALLEALVDTSSVAAEHDSAPNSPALNSNPVAKPLTAEEEQRKAFAAAAEVLVKGRRGSKSAVHAHGHGHGGLGHYHGNDERKDSESTVLRSNNSKKGNYMSLAMSESDVDIEAGKECANAEEEEVEDDEADGDGEEHDLSGWTNEKKLRWAAIYIIGGALTVTFFADPMCEVIGALGNKAGIGAFYISFIVTPLASNASEVISCLQFAKKKTDVSMGLTLSALYGAATMNNTFCLSIFMGLIYFRGLAWTYTAEVCGILVVIYAVGFIGLRQTIKMWQAAVVASLFPLSILFIWTINQFTR